MGRDRAPSAQALQEGTAPDPLALDPRCDLLPLQNRIKELGAQFGLKGLCCRSFWATEAACHPAICAYNLCVGLQRRLGQPVRAELATPRWRLFACAAVFSHTGGKPTLKLAVATTKGRRWWRTLLQHFAEHGSMLRCSCRPLRQGRPLPAHPPFICMSPAEPTTVSAMRRT
jgi:hypothetical protein